MGREVREVDYFNRWTKWTFYFLEAHLLTNGVQGWMGIAICLPLIRKWVCNGFLFVLLQVKMKHGTICWVCLLFSPFCLWWLFHSFLRAQNTCTLYVVRRRGGSRVCNHLSERSLSSHWMHQILSGTAHFWPFFITIASKHAVALHIYSKQNPFSDVIQFARL